MLLRLRRSKHSVQINDIVLLTAVTQKVVVARPITKGMKIILITDSDLVAVRGVGSQELSWRRMSGVVSWQFEQNPDAARTVILQWDWSGDFA